MKAFITTLIITVAMHYDKKHCETPVAHISNTIYLGGWDQKDRG
jgi:hypothetical protein